MGDIMRFKIPVKVKKTGSKATKTVLPPEQTKVERDKRILHPTDKQPDIYRAKVMDANRNVLIMPGEPSDEDHIIDWKLTKEMLSVGCTLDEVANRMGVPRNEVKNRCLQSTGKAWAEFEQECKAQLNYSLRTMQLKMALGWYREGVDGRKYYMPPNPVILLHVSKHYLGQTDESLKDKESEYTTYLFQDEEGGWLNPDEVPNGILNGMPVEFNEEGEVISLYEEETPDSNDIEE